MHQLSRAFAFLPYENVTKILKQTRSSDSRGKLRMEEEVIEDHLQWNTGGTCFSLCNALLKMLQASGFNAWIAMGDMHYGENIHCAVIVNFDRDRYLLDPGYLLHQPIRVPMEGGQSVATTTMNVVVLKSESINRISLYTNEGGIEKWRYRLKLEPTPESEFVEHWIHSFALNSMEQVILSRVNEGGRIYYRKNRLDFVSVAHRRKQRADHLIASDLSGIFGIPSDLIADAQQALSGRGKILTHHG